MATTYWTCTCGGRMARGAKRCQKCYLSEMGSGSDSPHWKGGRLVQANGYVRIYRPEHPRAHHKYVLEHIAVMESMIGRALHPHETVHHKNGQRGDNRPENLELWSKSQPAGQRVEDKLSWAKEFITQYAPSPAINPELGENITDISVDFDGTLAQSLWTPENRTREIGEPMWENLAKVKELTDAGYSVFIHTARGWEDQDAIESWLRRYGVPYRFVVCGKPLAHYYVDDRALHESVQSWVPLSLEPF